MYFLVVDFQGKNLKKGNNDNKTAPLEVWVRLQPILQWTLESRPRCAADTVVSQGQSLLRRLRPSINRSAERVLEEGQLEKAGVDTLIR